MKKIAVLFLCIVGLAACKPEKPVDTVYELKRADSLQDAGLLPAALQAYTSVLSHDSTNTHALLQKTLVLLKTGRYAEVIELSGKTLAFTDTHTAYFYRANALRLTGRGDEALKDYNTAISKKPGEYDYLHQRGLVYLNNHKYNEALADFTAAKEINPLDARAHHSIGSVYALQDDKQKALANFERSLSINPRYYQALMSKSVLLRDMGNADSCLSTLYTAINYYPDSAEFYKLRFDILFKKKMYNEAIIDAGVLAVLLPGKAPYYNSRGFCKLQQNNVDDALVDFERALQHDTAYAFAWNNRGYCFYLLQDYPAALKDISHSIQLDKTNAYAHRNLALVQLAMNQKTKACQSIAQSIALGYTKQYGNELENLKAKNCR